MKRYRLFTTICLVAAALLTACTQDEGMEQDTTLPEGQYPLQIGGITLSAQLEQGEAFPQTRVSENDNGTASVFDNNDIIKVCIGDNYDNAGEYLLNVGVDGKVTGTTINTPVYWQNTTPAIINAWYTTANESTPNTVMLNAQDENGLAYVLQGSSGTAVNYNIPAILTFTHKLAKVRVKLEGKRASAVTSVEVCGSTSCTYTNGNVTSGTQQDWLPMYHDMDNNVWEANLVPGSIQTDNGSFIRLNGSTTVGISNLTTLTAGAMHTLTVTVNPYPDGAQDITGDINGGGPYKVEGSRTEAITITGGSPHIYLYNANVSVTSGSAISITNGATPTIHVVGENTVTNNSSTVGAGIYVAQGSTVTITGSSREDKLTATGGGGGAGIGGYYHYDNSSSSCGDIYISNVTVTARGSSSAHNDHASGIGAAGSETVGSINISNAVVYAIGAGSNNYGAAAIGGGISNTSLTNKQTEFNITISDSEVHATRGCPYASYIGMAGDKLTSPDNYDIISTAQITNSTIYNESGTEITQ